MFLNTCSNILVGIFSFFARRATVFVAIGLKLGGGKQLIIPHLRPGAINNLSGVSKASSSYPESDNPAKDRQIRLEPDFRFSWIPTLALYHSRGHRPTNLLHFRKQNRI